MVLRWFELKSEESLASAKGRVDVRPGDNHGPLPPVHVAEEGCAGGRQPLKRSKKKHFVIRIPMEMSGLGNPTELESWLNSYVIISRYFLFQDKSKKTT